ncbi:hypothetical protein [Streptomyces sp. NPDC047453]|uniref:hypothetical protein n=1 Tax=Streptomyces sp. NPDC047453 TaxID=3154812 RepID=UPI0033F071F6
MDSTAASTVAFAVTAAGGIVAYYVVRTGLAATSRRASTNLRRAETFLAFVEPALEITDIVDRWPTLPTAARFEERDQARGNLQDLEQRLDAVLLEDGPDVQTAALQLLEECARLVHGLDVDAEPGPARPGPAGDSTSALTIPFTDACRECLDDQAHRPFRLRRARRRFGR